MWIVVLGWMYVVAMMSLAEATGPGGSLVGALFTFLLYGLAPLALAMYLLGARSRRRARNTAAAQEANSASAPDGSNHAAGRAVPSEREEA